MERSNNSLRDFLCAKGFKSTKGREIILKELETRGDHFNVDSLYSQPQKAEGVKAHHLQNIEASLETSSHRKDSILTRIVSIMCRYWLEGYTGISFARNVKRSLTFP